MEESSTGEVSRLQKFCRHNYRVFAAPRSSAVNVLKKHDSSDTEDHCIVHYSVLSRDVLVGHFASCVVIDSVFRLDQPN